MAHDQRSLARHALFWSGMLLLLVGAIHLAMTGHLQRWMAVRMTPEQVDLLLPPAMLNHVVAGLLLLPLGVGTMLAARAMEAGAAWPWRLALVNALSALALPVTILVVMDVSRYASWPFWTAVGLVFLVPVVMLACVFVLRPVNG